MPHWFDHAPVFTPRSSVGSRAGAPVWSGGPDPHHVSSPLHVAHNVRISPARGANDFSLSPFPDSDQRTDIAGCLKRVESRCGAVALGRTYLLPPLSFGGASMVPPWLRFHIPLIGRVEDWRAGRPLDRATFPVPSTSHAACRFPALRAPICFTPPLMGPILLGQLSARRVALDRR